MAGQHKNDVPPFSVLAVTHEGESDENLQRFFASLRAQTYPADEIVLVLDGPISNERKTLILELSDHLPIRLHQAEKSSLGKNLNIGLSHCRNDLIVRCDTDDKNLPRRFEILAKAFHHNQAAVCSGPIEEFQKSGARHIRNVPPGLVTRYNLSSFFRSPINHNNCCYSKSAVIAAGGYRGGRMEDFKLWVALLRQQKTLFNVDTILLHANADLLSHRRIGLDYFRSEIRLFCLNAPRFWGFGVIPAMAAFAIRAPLRFAITRPILALFYRTILRKKVDQQ